MAILLRSDVLQPGQPIPARYTCDGGDRSPPLAWAGAPAGTRAFALIVDDPDAPGGPFTHWVLFDLPAEARELPEGLPPSGRLPQGGVQGRNDFGRLGYNGPCPPRGRPHRYRFTLYALDGPVGLRPGAAKEELLRAIEGHVLDRGELVGTYGR